MRYHYRVGIMVPFVQKYYKQLVLVVAAVFMATMAMMSLFASAAPRGNNAAAANKIDICHLNDEGEFMKLNVSQNAQQGHEGHGDLLPGATEVPSMGAGYSLSSDCELEFTRSAEITSPAENAVLPLGTDVELAATLVDKDGNDNVQWAVREGTCAAGTGTAAGNVDGFSDSFSWDGASFAATVETDGWEAGDYCFIFNPTESAGDLAIRETREFSLAFEGPVGANVLGYVAPELDECDVTATNGDILQDVIDSANSGDTVCVDDGEYNEFTVDKPLTIAGLTNPNIGTAVIVPSSPAVNDLAAVNSSDVTITGLKFDGTGVSFTGNQLAGVRISPLSGSDIDNVDITYNVFNELNAVSGTASSKAVQYYSLNAADTITNSTIMHNVIDGVSAQSKGAYGVQTNGDTDGLTISYNTISNVGGAWGAGVAIDSTVEVDNTNTVVSRNVIVDGIQVIGGIAISVQVEHKVDQTGIVVNENNLLGVLHGTAIEATGDAVNAENNWWGDTEPSNRVHGPVDYTPWAEAEFSTT